MLGFRSASARTVRSLIFDASNQNGTITDNTCVGYTEAAVGARCTARADDNICAVRIQQSFFCASHGVTFLVMKKRVAETTRHNKYFEVLVLRL